MLGSLASPAGLLSHGPVYSPEAQTHGVGQDAYGRAWGLGSSPQGNTEGRLREGGFSIWGENGARLSDRVRRLDALGGTPHDRHLGRVDVDGNGCGLGYKGWCTIADHQLPSHQLEFPTLANCFQGTAAMNIVPQAQARKDVPK